MYRFWSFALFIVAMIGTIMCVPPSDFCQRPPRPWEQQEDDDDPFQLETLEPQVAPSPSRSDLSDQRSVESSEISAIMDDLIARQLLEPEVLINTPGSSGHSTPAYNRMSSRASSRSWDALQAALTPERDQPTGSGVPRNSEFYNELIRNQEDALADFRRHPNPTTQSQLIDCYKSRRLHEEINGYVCSPRPDVERRRQDIQQMRDFLATTRSELLGAARVENIIDERTMYDVRSGLIQIGQIAHGATTIWAHLLPHLQGAMGGGNSNHGSPSGGGGSSNSGGGASGSGGNWGASYRHRELRNVPPFIFKWMIKTNNVGKLTK